MTHRIAERIVALGCLLLFTAGCRTTPEPQKVGVFASTNHGLVELTAYGKQNGMHSYSLKDLLEIPKAPKLGRFYVNMPDSAITEVKVFWLPRLEKNFDEEGHTPLDATIESGTGKMYLISCATLSDKHEGYALLKVPMPLGVADRAYIVQLTN